MIVLSHENHSIIRFFCSVSALLHHFRFESIFFLGSSLSISENFKMHCIILAPVGWFHLIRQTISPHIHSSTHTCIAFRGFVFRRHSFSIHETCTAHVKHVTMVCAMYSSIHKHTQHRVPFHFNGIDGCILANFMK